MSASRYFNCKGVDYAYYNDLFSDCLKLDIEIAAHECFYVNIMQTIVQIK